MRIAAIDQGTTSTRALTVEADGELKVLHSVEHRQIYPQAGWLEHDPEELVRNIQACAAAVGEVDAIGIDNKEKVALPGTLSVKQRCLRLLYGRTTGRRRQSGY